MSALSYLELTKPRLLPLVLFSGLPALVLATGGWPSARNAVLVLVGTALAAGSANTLNSYLERDRDARMQRTVTRPLPAGRLDARRALAFGLALAILGPGLLWAAAGGTAAAVALAGILFYVFVYTLWLKPRTPAAVVVGGVAGAVAPLIADAAFDGRIGAAGWLLFAIVFVWQPPHFWSITLYRRDEYQAAGFPLLSNRIGLQALRFRILAWIVALVPLTIAVGVVSALGPLYLAGALGLGTWFVYRAVRLVREQTDVAARRLFRDSLLYLMGLFACMLADLALFVGVA